MTIVFSIISVLVGYIMYMLTLHESTENRIDIVLASMILWPIWLLCAIIYIIWMLFDFKEYK